MSLQVAQNVPDTEKAGEAQVKQLGALVLTKDQMCLRAKTVSTSRNQARQLSIVPVVPKWLPPSEHLFHLFDSPKAALACA